MCIPLIIGDNDFHLVVDLGKLLNHADKIVIEYGKYKENNTIVKKQKKKQL